MEVPRNAVFNGNEVFVIHDSLLIKENIKIHKINRDKLYFSGLQEGIFVVSEPLINAVENTRVNILGENNEEENLTEKPKSKNI